MKFHELSVEEQELIEKQLDEAYKEDFIVQPSKAVRDHARSYADSLFDAKYTFN